MNASTPIASTTRPLLSIIIVAYNSNAVLKDCLLSIEAFNPWGERLEVVVVDNCPTTGLHEMMQALPLAFAWTYVPNPKNDGFGAGNNRGAEAAKADKLFFLNPDTLLLDAATLTLTVERLDANQHAVIGYTLIDGAGQPTDSYSFFFEDFALFPWFHWLTKRNFYAPNTNAFLQRRVWPWGAAFAVNRAAFEAAGCFDEAMFLCNEEPDLMHRMPKRKVEILPCQIVHLEGHGKAVPASRYLASFRTLQYYFEKHHLNARAYWRYFAFRLRLKRWLRRPADPALMEAYQQFAAEQARK